MYKKNKSMCLQCLFCYILNNIITCGLTHFLFHTLSGYGAQFMSAKSSLTSASRQQKQWQSQCACMCVRLGGVRGGII